MKKFLCFALAFAMSVGVFAVSACDSGKEEPELPGHEQQQPEGPSQQQPVPEIGANTKNELLESLMTAEIDSGAVNAKISNYSVTSGGNKVVDNGNMDVTVHFDETDTGILYDMFQQESEGGDGSYTMQFIRADAIYNAYGKWSDAGVEVGDFTALLAAYKGSDYLGFQRTPITLDEGGQASPAETVPVSLVTKLAANLSELAGNGELAAIPGGYTVSYDLDKTLTSLAESLLEIVETVTPATKVSELVENPMIVSTLQTLCKGLKGSDVTGLPMLADMQEILPAAGDSSLFDYIKTVLTSETFFAALFDGAPETLTCLADLTVADIAALAGLASESGEEVAGIIETVKAMLTDVKADLVGGIFKYALSAGEEPMDFSGSAEIGFTLNFSADKSFTGVEASVKSLSAKTENNTVTVTGEGSVSVSLTEAYTFTDLKGMKYETEEYNENFFAPSSNEQEGYLGDLYLGSKSDTSENKMLEGSFEYSCSYTVSKDAVKITLSIPDFKVNLSATLTIAQMKGATSDTPLEVPLHSEQSLTWTYEDTSFSVTVIGNVYKYESNVSIELGFNAWSEGYEVKSFNSITRVYANYAHALQTIA